MEKIIPCLIEGICEKSTKSFRINYVRQRFFKDAFYSFLIGWVFEKPKSFQFCHAIFKNLLRWPCNCAHFSVNVTIDYFLWVNHFCLFGVNITWACCITFYCIGEFYFLTFSRIFSSIFMMDIYILFDNLLLCFGVKVVVLRY